ncbi:ABC transporter G family member 8 [Hondaea fermentalgiana]|uniref:ABC transporter G family member 8 n=1 Tax=Hondaea fermentalgiana TaxID=2315210 RepID=A0A2R5GHB0_9STRA|nr:ABC transporter G family member 8 [Hondaea fermentalgiana]|eukprot:GBG29729.1 ABC transporter G family member 8 [Hondaea fermentalgiana]
MAQGPPGPRRRRSDAGAHAQTALPDDVCAWEDLDGARLLRGLGARLEMGLEQTRWGDRTLLWLHEEPGAEEHESASSPSSMASVSSSAASTMSTRNTKHVTSAWTQAAIQEAHASNPYHFVLLGQDQTRTAQRRNALMDQVFQRCMQSGEETSRRVRRLRRNLALVDTLLDSLCLPDSAPPLAQRVRFHVADGVLVHAVIDVPLLDLSRMWEFDIFLQLAGTERISHQYPRCVASSARRVALESHDPMAVEQRFAATMDILQGFGISSDEVTSLLRILRAVLEIGHAQVPDAGDDARLETASKLLGMPARIDFFAMRGESVSGASDGSGSRSNAGQHAVRARDALAETIFDATFQWIFARVNRALVKDLGAQKNVDHVSNISIVQFPPLVTSEGPIRLEGELLRNAACESLHLVAAKVIREAEASSQSRLRDATDEDLARAEDVVGVMDSFVNELASTRGFSAMHHERKTASVNHFTGAISYDLKALRSAEADDNIEDIMLETTNLFVRKMIDASVRSHRGSAVKRHYMGLENLMPPLRKGKLHIVRCIDANRLEAVLREEGLSQVATLRRKACYPLRKTWATVLRMLPKETRARLGRRVDRAQLRLELADRLENLTQDPFHVRQLIYTTGPYPRLFYVDPFTGEFKGDIAWEEGVTRAVATSNTDFVVYSIPDPFKGKAEWHFSVLPSTNDAFAHDWVRALQRAFSVRQLFALPRGVYEYTPLQQMLCKGQLLKRSSLARASWKERHFVLRTGSLEWFRRRGDVDSRGYIVIDHHTGVYASKERFSFEITSPALSKPLRLRARSKETLFYWVNGITEAIHAAHDSLALNTAPSSPAKHPSHENRKKNTMAQQLEFVDLNYYVKPKNASEQLHVLKGVSGVITAGRLCAIMGSSGAGKSTLLDILAMRKTVGRATGQILLDREPLPSRQVWKHMAGYVMQHDCLLSTATVFETLMFSKQLRTKYKTVSYEDQKRHVEQILDEVGLSHRRNARIGDEDQRSLSGGEMRRVSIAQELVAECSILFLDEPTSGLDSGSARAVMELLRALAARDRIVAATIHQPSSQICALFDDLLMLGQGEMCYAGPWSEAVEHFDRIGYPCPQYTNPTDFILDLTRDQEAFPTLTARAYDSSAVAMTHSQILTARAEADTDETVVLHMTPWIFQFKLLCIRNFQQWIRNPLILISELSQYIIFGLLIGALYYDISDEASAGLFDRTAAIFFVLTTICFIPSFTVVTLAREERPLQRREFASGMYDVSANFVAKMIVMIPFEVFLSLLFSICCYFLIGLSVSGEQFFIFLAIVVIFQLISETLGSICAIATPNPTIGVLMLSMVLLIALSFGGFVVSAPRSYYVWFEKINFFVYAYTALALNECENLTVYADGHPVNALDLLRADDRIRNDFSLGENIGILVAFLVFFRLFALALVYLSSSKSSFAFEAREKGTGFKVPGNPADAPISAKGPDTRINVE